MKKGSTNQYDLPVNWEKTEIFSFAQLTSAIVQIHSETQCSAIKAINRYATVRNYLIGFYIVEYEQNGNDRAAYGERLLKRLAENINIKGINDTLLKNCRRFYLLYPQVKQYLTNGISPTLSDFSRKSATPSHQFINNANDIINKLSFSHIIEIMTVNDSFARFFYETECIKCSWSVKELRRQISTNLYFRCGISRNPELLLSQTVSEQLPSLSIKDPFSLEFLGLDNKNAISEDDLEDALIIHLQDFILELGKGFCFEARQKRMIIDDEYYYADLVFYNRILHCNVIIELKNNEFKHSDLSQLNAYISYFRDNEMNPGDNPPVGILLCTRKGEKMVEYAIAGMDNNLFVSTYMLTLPNTKQLEEFIIKELKKEDV